MEITQVTQKSPSVWVLTLADGRSYEIDRTCVLEYALLNRLEIDDETLQEMQQTYCERHALQQALRWLNYRPYTFKAMFQRLMPIYGEATSFAVLKRLTEMGGINDYQYAQQMALLCGGAERLWTAASSRDDAAERRSEKCNCSSLTAL